MKTIGKILLILSIIAGIAPRLFAIEGLQIAVQGTNAVLWWPSDTSESYLIQYRRTLSVTDSWTTLADYYPPDYSGSNITYFTDTNFVDYGSSVSGGGTNSGGGGIEPMMAMGASSPLTASEPMVLETNGDMVPLIIFPSGFDLSGMTIIDPSTSESISGSGLVMADASVASPNGFQPDGANGASGTTSPGTGFYQVVRDGVHMIGVTNGMVWSGVVKIPLEVGNAYGSLLSFSINDNDASVAVGNSTQLAPFNSPLMAVVDTTLMSNGTYNISAYANWNDGNGGEWDASSPTFSITTSNEITFENWMPQFGELSDLLLFRATSAHTNVDWTVDVFGSSNNYIGTIGGHSDDGDISFTWDLVGPDNVAHTNDAFFNFDITTPYTDPPAPPTYRQTDPWPAKGQWCEVCQHAWDNSEDPESIYTQVNWFVGQAGANGGLVPHPQSTITDGSPYALTFGADDPQGDTDWANFRKALYDPLTRNLVYIGHGAPNGLGASSGTNRFISAAEVAATLGNDGKTNRHAFRFVFIDACDTADGNFCESFGIPKKQNVSEQDTLNGGMRPRAFIGWPDTKWITVNQGSPNYDHINFINQIQSQITTYGFGIKRAIDAAKTQNNVGIFISANMVVYGDWDLTPWNFNR